MLTASPAWCWCVEGNSAGCHAAARRGALFAQVSISDSNHATEFPMSWRRLETCPAISSQ